MKTLCRGPRAAISPTRYAALVLLMAPSLALAQAATHSALAPLAAPADRGLTVLGFAGMVARSDEVVRAQKLEEAIAEQGLRGAGAIYEPFFSTTVGRDGKFLPTTAEEYFQRGGSASGQGSPVPFEARINQVKAAVGAKGSTGADWEVSYNLDGIVNSLQARLGSGYISPEYRGSFGFSISQPLMRNAGKEVTESGIRIAEREESIAKETVRQIMAQRLNEALQTYLFAQRAQERVRWRELALRLASQLEVEVSRQHEAGLKSRNELTEARANLALRQAQVAQAQQDLEEQLNALQVFLSASPSTQETPSAQRWVPSEPLKLPPPEYSDSLRMTDTQTAFDRRPETRVNRLRIEREEYRRFAAKNQTEPELNFKVRYGKESLLDRATWFYNYLERGSPYNAWGVGLFFRIGIGGDIKKESEYQTAILRKSQAELSLGAAQQRIVNELLGVKAVLDRAVQQANRQAEIVSAQEELLAAERRMVSEGQKSALDILRREQEITVSREALADAIVQVNRTSFIASQANGGLLARLGLE